MASRSPFPSTSLNHSLDQNHRSLSRSFPFQVEGLLSCSHFLLGAVHVTPTASARKAWLSRSTGSPFAHARFQTSLVSFHFAFFILGIFSLRLLILFLYDLIRHELWFLEPSLGLPDTRSPRLHRSPSRSTRTGSLYVTHFKSMLDFGFFAHFYVWEK